MIGADNLVLANARLVLPDEVVLGSLQVRDGRIDAIETGARVPKGAFDCAGDLVAPGLVELHTDNLERHMRPRPHVPWPHDAAILAHDAELAGAGITTVLDALRVGSNADVNDHYRRYARGVATEILQMRRDGMLKIEHFLHLRAETCSVTLIEELAEFSPADDVRLVSLMDHRPGQRQFTDLPKYKDYMVGKYGLSDAGFRDHVDGLLAVHDRFGPENEAEAVRMTRQLGAVLASHDDTTAAQVAVSAAHGVALAEFPTTLEAAQSSRAAGIAVMMGAPNLMRGGSHSGNVAAGDLAAAGMLDLLSSDYIPNALLLGAMRLAEIWDDLARGLHTVTAAPADAVGLSDRGRIAPTLRADLIRIDTHGSRPVVRGVWVGGTRAA